MKTLIIPGLLALLCAMAIVLILTTTILWFMVYAALTHEAHLRMLFSEVGVDYDRIDDEDYWNGIGNYPSEHDFSYPIVTRKEGMSC